MNKRKRFDWLLGAVLALGLALAAGCGRQEEPKEPTVALELSQMQNVCELATLECYYHNTAKFDSQKRVLFWNTSSGCGLNIPGL